MINENTLVIFKIIEAFKKYRKIEISLDKLKQYIWDCSQEITHNNNWSLREYLISVEAELDTIQFTIDTNKIFKCVLKLCDKVEKKLLNEIKVKNESYL